MKAFTRTKYGGPEVLRLTEVDKPKPGDNELLVRVVANSANPADWHVLRGTPVLARFAFGLFKPKKPILGADFAGIVAETGMNVRNFKAGDRVYGENLAEGTFAEYTVVPPDSCALIPAGLDFNEMAGVPVAGLTALQAVVTHGQLKPGESVLINGASGGVGHFTVQVAKAYGAMVTGVCSRKNRDFVLSLGADAVICYDEENIHEHPGKYDLVIDTHGNLRHQDYRRMGQRGVMIGFINMHHLISVLLKRALSKFPLAQFTAQASTHDLEVLASLIKNGAVKTHIDRSYRYEQIPEAIDYIEAMHTRGKVVMLWG